MERYWANIIRTANVEETNLQNEIEYLENEIAATGLRVVTAGVGSDIQIQINDLPT